MSSKMFHKLVGTTFAIGATIHLLRVVFGWDIVLAAWEFPVWLSLVAFVVLVYLSYTAFKLGGVLK